MRFYRKNRPVRTLACLYKEESDPSDANRQTEVIALKLQGLVTILAQFTVGNNVEKSGTSDVVGNRESNAKMMRTRRKV